MISTVYCTLHNRAEEVQEVNEVHRFKVCELGPDGASHENGDWAVEVQGRLECGRAVHFVGSLGWLGR